MKSIPLHQQTTKVLYPRPIQKNRSRHYDSSPRFLRSKPTLIPSRPLNLIDRAMSMLIRMPIAPALSRQRRAAFPTFITFPSSTIDKCGRRSSSSLRLATSARALLPRQWQQKDRPRRTRILNRPQPSNSLLLPRPSRLRNQERVPRPHQRLIHPPHLPALLRQLMISHQLQAVAVRAEMRIFCREVGELAGDGLDVLLRVAGPGARRGRRGGGGVGTSLVDGYGQVVWRCGG